MTGTQCRVPRKREGSKPPKSTSPPKEESGFLEEGGDVSHLFSFSILKKKCGLIPLCFPQMLRVLSLTLVWSELCDAQHASKKPPCYPAAP